MMSYTNYDIVPAALAGTDATTGTGNFSTDHYDHPRFVAPYTGHLPSRLREILNARFRAGAIRQVIYSYSTPIAWLDGDVWITPDVTYSITTSSKHVTHLYQLPNRRYVPWDAGMEEYLAVLAGTTRYVPNYRNRSVGRYVAA